MIVLLCISIPSAIILIRAYLRYTFGICSCKTDMANKVVIVTGANAGIGFETAKDLARRGAKVILACRSEDRGSKARKQIIKETENKDVHLKLVDFASFKSVRAFCKDILENEKKIDVLVNNAGIMCQDGELTEDNLTIESQVNYFSHFLLTVSLLPLLKSSAPSRIVNVSSLAHWFGTVDLETFHKPNETYFSFKVYSNTKLANLLFMEKLKRELVDTGVAVNSVHPGPVNTSIVKSKVMKWASRTMYSIVLTPWEGAQSSIHVAVAPELGHVSGKYIVGCKEARMSGTAQDSQLANKLWEYSMKIVSPYLESDKLSVVNIT